MELVERWWNGQWGRLVRRDVWLYREVVWHVHARDGDDETGRQLRWRYRNEQAAREMVDRLISAKGPGEWREMTKTSKPPPRPSSEGDAI